MFISVDTLANDLLQYSAGHDHFAMYRIRNTEVGRAVLQMAAGKQPDALPDVDDADRFDQLKAAAIKFVRDVMLSPTSDHYALLGVAVDAEGNAIREQFRRLMGLVHPDARPVDFPEDAATRVNRAYAVLADGDARAAYTEELFGPPAGAVATKPRAAARPGDAALAPAASGFGARLAGMAEMFRSRSTLLWLAVLLVAPLGIWVASLMSQDAPARLVEARPKLQTANSIVGTVAETPAQPAATPLAAASPPVIPAPASSTATAVTPPVVVSGPVPATRPALTSRTADVAKLPPRTERMTASGAPGARVAPGGTAVAGERTPAGLMSNQLSERSLALTSRGAPASSTAVSSAEPSRPAAQRDLAPVAATPAPAPAAAAPVPAIAAAAPPATTAARGETAERSDNASRARTSDADEILVRFTNAYESGSINGFAQLLSPAMAGRRQMLNEYERVFNATRQRSIKFNQLKHTANGDRVATSGYATVTTVDRDNRTTTQRVFLEFEIGRERGEARIERLANYVLH